MRGVLGAVVQLVIGIVAGYVMFYETAGRLHGIPAVSLCGAMMGRFDSPAQPVEGG